VGFDAWLGRICFFSQASSLALRRAHFRHIVVLFNVGKVAGA
jgi:hypothetical protein